MSPRRQALLVAGWEFRRYFKWKDQVAGLVIFAVLGLIGYGASRLATGGRVVTVAATGIELVAAEGGRMRVVPAPADSAGQEALLDTGDVDGILHRRADGAFELKVRKDPRFLPELRAALADLERRERMSAAGISETQLAVILAPPRLEVRFGDPARQRAGRAERLVAAVFLFLVILAVFTSMAYLLTGITGEKQLRVTESITAIIPPQAWIDGKILGIGAYAMTTILNMMVGGVLLAVLGTYAWGFVIPDVFVRPAVLLLLVAYSLLALAMWNAAFAAFASTIDDPNTSTRTSVMFLPMLPLVMTFGVLRDPDGLASRVMSLVPLTSPSAMPMRVILSNPGAAEIAASLALLAAMAWLFRRLAGRVFEVGMLMYGKEPTLREMWRWMTAPGR
ncbi:MAG: ABC transporter permease [Gemmatimonadaceae bacterium]|nr:ABC transporter permease [Gemmatimonadaceae bacterium]